MTSLAGMLSRFLMGFASCFSGLRRCGRDGDFYAGGAVAGRRTYRPAGVDSWSRPFYSPAAVSAKPVIRVWYGVPFQIGRLFWCPSASLMSFCTRRRLLW